MSTSISEPNKNDQSVRKQLVELLQKGNAHATLSDALQDLPTQLRSVKPEKLPYNIWQLVEHIRIAQWDIVEFSGNPKHQSPQWPDEYWPAEEAPASEDAWKKSLTQIHQDQQRFIALLNDPENDLYQPFPYGDGQNLLREAFLIADHTSYHTGQIILIRRLLDNWQS